MEREGQTSPGAAARVNYTNILKCSVHLRLTHPEQGENELPLFALLFLPASKLPKSKMQKKTPPKQPFYFFPTDSFTPFLHPFQIISESPLLTRLWTGPLSHILGQTKLSPMSGKYWIEFLHLASEMNTWKKNFIYQGLVFNSTIVGI